MPANDKDARKASDGYLAKQSKQSSQSPQQIVRFPNASLQIKTLISSYADWIVR